jgi:hypothetical protein
VANLFIVSVLLGAVLGRFFKVLVLVPACAFMLAAVLVRSAAFEHGLLRTLLEFGLLNATLQIGYVSGLLSFFIPSASQRHGKPAAARPLLRQ